MVSHSGNGTFSLPVSPRVLLINPPYPFIRGEPKHASPPLGLAYIAACLEALSIPVRILDCVLDGYNTELKLDDGTRAYGLRGGELLARIADYRPDLIGISCLFSTLHSIVNDVLHDVKGAFPSVPLVLGGHHPTVLPEPFLHDSMADFVIAGEGEVALVRLIEHLQGDRPIERVDNLVWRGEDAILRNPRTFIRNLDDLPLPARHLLDLEGYIRIGLMHGESKLNSRATTLITSRGCPGECIFCSIHPVWGRSFRSHSPGYVLDELRHLADDCGIDHFLFEDDNLTLDRERATRILSAMTEDDRRFTWATPNGVAVSTLNGELLRLMKSSGCHRLTLAVESGDSHTLNRIVRKRLGLDRVLQVVDWCNGFDIPTTAFFVVGLPGETRRSLRRSLDFAVKLDVGSLNIMIATPYPGTPLYRQCVEKGYLVSDFRWENLTTGRGQIATDEFQPRDLHILVTRTLLRHAIRHPRRVFRRFREKAVASPGATLQFVTKLFRSGV